MAVYYYVSASLPMLIDSEQDAPISSDELLEICRRFVADGDYRSLQASTLNPEDASASGICSEYRDWERSLRNELVLLRSAEQNLNPEDYIREAETVSGTSVIASESMGKDSPLEAELYLDGCRWSKIDELAAGHYFDIELITIYGMKLKII